MKRGFLGLAASVALLFLGGRADAQQWEEIDFDEGIRTWKREVPGTSFVEFRGTGNIDAPMKIVTAVIREVDHKHEWMYHCAGERALRYISSTEVIVNNRTKSPPLISDRDVVLRAKATILPKERAIHVEFKNIDGPLVEGVVRMPRLTGFWHIKYVGPNTTEVTYQVQADPGGALPAWLVNWASRSLPFHTLANLRTQAKKPQLYDKDIAVLEASFDWSPLEGASASGAKAEAAAAPAP